MRTLVQLSDLHFGRIDERLIDPLVAAVGALAPDVVVVSGDLTQRARSAQFRAARAFLDRLPHPQVVVPGNHDIPMHNVFDRFVRPLDKYRRWITDDLEPAHVDDEIAVLGVNTARSATIKDGRVSEAQLARLAARMDALGPEVTRVVVSHHPFDVPAAHGDGDIVGRASLAMRTFAAHGVDVLLSGHLHASHAGDTAVRHRLGDYAALFVQSGTTTSTRGRGEANAFNVLHIAPRRIGVEHHAWDDAMHAFRPGAARTFVRGRKGWAAAADA